MGDFITLKTWEQYTREICKNDKNFIIIDILSFNEKNFNEKIAKELQNKTIILLNPDIDFPPPRDPYLNDNMLDMQYNSRICYKIINCLEKYNIKIVCYSSSVKHPNVFMIPLGITWQVPIYNINSVEKDITCYANFGIPHVDCWHGKIRNELKSIINNIDYIQQENIATDTKQRKTNDMYNNYFNKLSNSKFTLCPRGCGIDCYRFYDSLYYNCIPVILKVDGFHENMTQFPILVLESWNDLRLYDKNSLDILYEQLMNDFTSYKDFLKISSYVLK